MNGILHISSRSLWACGLALAMSVPLGGASASGFKLLYTFTGGTDGGDPFDALIDIKGNLWGTAFDGGADGYGTVFKVAPDGTESVLYSFTGGSDGSNPEAGLIRDAAGNLYGTTYFGGGTGCGGGGCGTV
ncbi:MAG: choice-of-anchor tandem repeat GloVer-containing protein, partial [Rhizomicrobium sp.]